MLLEFIESAEKQRLFANMFKMALQAKGKLGFGDGFHWWQFLQFLVTTSKIVRAAIAIHFREKQGQIR